MEPNRAYVCPDIFHEELFADMDLIIRAPQPTAATATSTSSSSAAEATTAGKVGLLASPLTSQPIKRQKCRQTMSCSSAAAHAAGATGSHAAATQDAPSAGVCESVDWVELNRMPAHRAILCSSEYFRPQIMRWQNVECSTSNRPQASLTLDSADQLPAALAVLAAMYGAQTAAEGLKDQVQQIQALVIADMLQVQHVVQQAVQELTADVKRGGLSATAVAALSKLQAMPRCLLPLIQVALQHWSSSIGSDASLGVVLTAPNSSQFRDVLLTILGDLQQVWAERELWSLMCDMPLPAMQLLLSSDQLQVPSEDTVLYTAQMYAECNVIGPEEAALLGELVRGPHLSRYWLSAMAVSGDAEDRLLCRHIPELSMLLGLKAVDSTPSRALIEAELPSAPPSWLLDTRIVKELRCGVRLQWNLSLEDLRQACDMCHDSRQCERIFSPLLTPPMMGLVWQLILVCTWQEAGVQIGLFTSAENAVSGLYCRFGFSITAGDFSKCVELTPPVRGCREEGWEDFFDLGPMPGWHEPIWSDKGLPTTGELLLNLNVHTVL